MNESAWLLICMGLLILIIVIYHYWTKQKKPVIKAVDTRSWVLTQKSEAALLEIAARMKRVR